MDFSRLSISHILLTGAGFTHNFGAPLADEMWSLIFNHPYIRSTERVHALLRNNFDFEDAYDEVMSGDDYNHDERSAIHTAVLDAYEKIDGIVLGWIDNPNSSRRINRNNVNKLIAQFAGNRHECGFFFTLNQDLFAERHYTGEHAAAPSIPGLQKGNRFSSSFNQEIDNTNRITVPEREEIHKKASEDLRDAHFCYVKLHGSYDWRKHDDSLQLVIGRGKEDIISREPIFRLNWELFKSVLKQGARRLLVIGYSFRDEHVNKEITKAIAEYGLRLIILCPDKPREFLEKHLMLADTEHGNDIRKAIDGYFPYTLEELFPGGQMEVADAAKRLFEAVTG
jgi:hypothetical protein